MTDLQKLLDVLTACNADYDRIDDDDDIYILVASHMTHSLMEFQFDKDGKGVRVN